MEWTLWEPLRVNSDDKLTLPNEVQTHISTHFKGDENRGVYWALEINARIAVISNWRIEEHEDYIPNNRVTAITDGGLYIRAPQKIKSGVSYEFSNEANLSYMAHSEMLSGERRAVYIIPVNDLLPLLHVDDTEESQLGTVLNSSPSASTTTH